MSDGSAAPHLAMRRLSKRFGRSHALRAIDLDVPPGQCVALLGPNGAGKSTLLRVVAGLVRPTGGTLSVDGRSMREAGVALRSRLGYLGHQTMLYASLSARENLRFAGRLHGIERPARRADELLERLDLVTRGDQLVGTLSRGLRQRVALARALVHDPTLVLLDEPFTGLDRRAASLLQELLAEVRSRRRTMLVVTHDVARGLAVADRAVVLVDGRLELERMLGVASEPAGDAARADFDRAYAACLGIGEAAEPRPEGAGGERAW